MKRGKELSDKTKNVISVFAIVAVASFLFIYLFFSTNLFNFDAEGMARIQKLDQGLDVEIPNVVIGGEDDIKAKKGDIVIPIIPINPSDLQNIAHPDYPDFFESYNTNINNNVLTISDTIIYNTGYYSANGGAWASYNLQGNAYTSGSPWLLDSATSNLPSILSTGGPHYVLVYSCSLVNNAWDCHENKWQLNIMNDNSNPDPDPITKETSICLSCDDGGCSCTSDEKCSPQGVCLLDVGNHNTYFVSPSGSNGGSGSYGSPWGTWDYAFDRLSPGDILYMRGGEWRPSSYGSRPYITSSDVSGTPSNPIRIFNYPGEVPVLNGEAISPVMYNTGLRLSSSKNLHLKGFTIMNVKQVVSSSDQQPSIGIQCSACENIIYENLIIRDIEGRGIEHADWHSRSGKDVSYFINTDVYNLFTPYEGSPGNAADAIIASVDATDEIYFYGVRTWNFADDGVNGGGNGAFFHVKNSWSMSSKKYFGLSSAWEIEGHPFKFGGTYTSSVPGYSIGGEPFLIIENSIGANSVGRGMQNNNNLRSREMPNNALIRNNLLYQVGLGNRGSASYYEDVGGTSYPHTSDYKNNIDLKGSSTNQEISIKDSSHSYNSWDSGVTATDSDFISLDYWELFNTPRKPDGSLPDVSFGHLAQGSDLIDAGTRIPGYHCNSPGYQTGCRVWYGANPDLGPFESNY